MSSGDSTVSVTGTDEYPVVGSFDDLDLQEGLLRGIHSYGFEGPSAIQQRAIRPVTDGRDTVIFDQSRTGKTATFVIGALHRIDFDLEACQTLILAPTRELTNQLREVVLALGDHLKVQCHACLGETFVDGVHVVVGTPDRVLDMASKSHLRLDDLKTFVLEDADEMLSCGFKDHQVDFYGDLV
jgi:translation initiation factor 4A